ncbi:protein phosphatase 1 regulatory subunit 12C-like, partial [Zonotrichia leucophrys gambelii]|uniref:protein phosphatase 1 regulatory subunit 12C-like n=1 Tax=Zonotrichia leucophrys gambelii TaxID=257770 RepID=UPI0031402B95
PQIPLKSHFLPEFPRSFAQPEVIISVIFIFARICGFSPRTSVSQHRSREQPQIPLKSHFLPEFPRSFAQTEVIIYNIFIFARICGFSPRTSVSRRSSREKLSLLQARERVGEGALPPPLSPPGGGGAESDEGGDSEGEGPEGEPRPLTGDPPEAPPPNGPAPPLPPPPGALCRSGSLGAWPGPARDTPPAQAPPPVRRSASSPRLQAPPTGPEPPGRPSPTQRPPSPSPAPPGAPRDPPEPRVRRPFQPPARDEESESQRKARSRLMRQARRATQGVTLTELRAAEQGIGRAAEGRGQEQPIRDEGGREPADPPRLPAPPAQVPPGGPAPSQVTDSNGPAEAPPPPSHAPAPPPNGLRPPPAPPFDYQQLFQELWVENERIREQLQEAELALTQSRLELERVTQRQERSAERPARLELERFERRALELKAAELEEELKALSDLRADNQRLKDENAALIRVISKLSK